MDASAPVVTRGMAFSDGDVERVFDNGLMRLEVHLEEQAIGRSRKNSLPLPRFIAYSPSLVRRSALIGRA